MVDYGVLAVEMEASALYTLARSHGRRALAICTVSDHLVTGERRTSAEREQTFADMVEIALAARDLPFCEPGVFGLLRRREPAAPSPNRGRAGRSGSTSRRCARSRTRRAPAPSGTPASSAQASR